MNNPLILDDIDYCYNNANIIECNEANLLLIDRRNLIKLTKDVTSTVETEGDVKDVITTGAFKPVKYIIKL